MQYRKEYADDERPALAYLRGAGTMKAVVRMRFARITSR
jgi:hypothetical protein